VRFYHIALDAANNVVDAGANITIYLTISDVSNSLL
jgi:hypothetical protein